MATTVGSIEYDVRLNLRNLQSDVKSAEKIVNSGNAEMEKSSKKAGGAMSAAYGAIAGVAATVANKAINSITGSIDQAIKRVDTLNNSSRTFSNMGIEASKSSKAVGNLEKSIKGLPTPLDSAIRGMTSLTATYGDVDKGQKVFSSLNNAILGFGGTAAQVDNAITQLSQLPMDGPLDAQTWNSLRNSGITPVLVAMAKESGMSVSEMKTAFGEGELTVQDFTDRLIDMNEKGGGGLTSLEDIAKDSTKGIGTGFANLQTSIVRGMAKIIESVGSENISNAITGLAVAFEGVLVAVVAVIKFIQDNSKVFQTLAIIIGSILTPAILAYTAATIVAGVQSLIAGAKMAAAWLLALGPIGLIIAVVAAAVGLIIANWDTVKGVVVGVWETIKNAVSSAFSWIKKNWPLVLAIITGPIGIAAALIIKNFDKIKSAVSGVWKWIKGVFGTIGSVAATIIKAPVNAIIGFAENTINGFIRAINGAIGSINNIPGVNIPTLGEMNIPKLAEGGIVKARPGGILANIGEGGQDEAVIPLDRLEKMLTNNSANMNVTVNMSGIMSSGKSDERAIANRMAKLINETVMAKTGKNAIVGV